MKALLFTVIASLPFSSMAADIASCSNPTGKGYYPELGIVKKSDAGWEDEAIIGGITKAVKRDDGSFDILFVDVRKEIISATADGGTVLLLNRGERQVSFLVVYPGKTAEVYTFLTNNSGKSEYIEVLSRAGDGVLITKASVMRGDCDYINFDALYVGVLNGSQYVLAELVWLHKRHGRYSLPCRLLRYTSRLNLGVKSYQLA